MCAKVNTPAFTKGKKQFSAYDVESTCKIANVRIHFERVIEISLKKTFHNRFNDSYHNAD